jgi:hypothetical protein
MIILRLSIIRKLNQYNIYIMNMYIIYIYMYMYIYIYTNDNHLAVEEGLLQNSLYIYDMAIVFCKHSCFYTKNQIQNIIIA